MKRGVLLVLTCFAIIVYSVAHPSLGHTARGPQIMSETSAAQPGEVVPARLYKPIRTSYAPLSPEVLSAVGARDVEDYGPFAVVSVPTDAINAATAAASQLGLKLAAAPDLAEIRINVYTIPGTATVPGSLPAGLQIADYTGAVGLYLVQFKGPVRSEWLASLQDYGARVIQYHAENTYLVALSPSATAGLAGVPGLRHYIVYQPAYKLAPALATALPPVDPTLSVVIQLDRGQPWEELAAKLLDSDGKPALTAELGDYVDVHAALTPAAIQSLARDPRVIWIEPASQIGLSDERACQILWSGSVPIPRQTPYYRDSLSANQVLDTSAYTVNVIDSGLDRGQGFPVNADLGTRVVGWVGEDYYHTTHDGITHGTMVAGVIAGDPVTGTMLTDSGGYYYGSGVAPMAKLRITTFLNEFGLPSWDFTTVASRLQTADKSAWAAGARFQNMSFNLYGSSPSNPTVQTYDTLAQEIDLLIRDSYGDFRLPYGSVNPMFMGISAANTDQSLYAPCATCVVSGGTAKNAVVMGSTSETRDSSNSSGCGDSGAINEVSSTSARGVYAESARIKPDFVAPGKRIVSAFTGWAFQDIPYGDTAPLPCWTLCPSDNTLFPPSCAGVVAGTSNHYGLSAGTSFSAPIATGEAVILSKRFNNLTSGADPSPAMIKAMMLIGSDRMIGGRVVGGPGLTSTPGAQGWGRLNMAGTTGQGASLFDSTASRYFDEDHGSAGRRFTATGQTYTMTFTVANSAKDVRIALVFTDRYGAAGANPAKVNELSVYALQGSTTYCDGRAYDASGYTSPTTGTCGAPDGANNVHFINIHSGFTGQFQVQMHADNITQIAVPFVDGRTPNQDWALWVWNAY